MAYKSQVTNKYFGAGFKGAPKSNRNIASTELGQIVSALKNDLTPALSALGVAEVEGMQDAATKKMQKLYASGKDSKTINEEILAGKHKDLEHKYTESVVNGQFGRIEAYETINKITENIGNYKPREQSLETFWQGYLPNFDEKGQFFTEGFSVVFNEYKAKALSKDAENRAIFQENQKINGIVNSLKGEYKQNGYQEGKAWKLVESFGSPLPFSGKQKNYFVNNAAKNKSMFLFIEDLVRTATTTEQLDHAILLLEEARGGKHKLGSLSETYNAEEVSKLYGSILDRRESIATNAWNIRTRNNIIKSDNYINDYFAYLSGGTLSDGQGTVVRDGASPMQIQEYDIKAEETLNEMLDFDMTLAQSIITIKSNVNELDRSQTELEKLLIDVENGVYNDDLKGMTSAIANAGGNISDKTTFMSAWTNARNRKINNLSLFPFLNDTFWQQSKKFVYDTIMIDDRLVTIQKDETKRMIIANAIINEYQKKVREFYQQDPEPSQTLNNGNDWAEWNNRRVAFKIATEKAILDAYKTEQTFKALNELVNSGTTNQISKLIASEASEHAITSIIGSRTNVINENLSKKLATIEDIKETSAKTLTPISELSLIKEQVKLAKIDLEKAGVTFLDDEEITNLILDKLGIKDSDVNFDEAQAEMRTNIETLISQGFDKAMPQLVAQKDKILTFWKDESKLSTPESIVAQTEFLSNLFGEVTGLGKDFVPNVLLRIDPITLDLIAQSLNVDTDSFRTTLETIFKINLPS